MPSTRLPLRPCGTVAPGRRPAPPSARSLLAGLDEQLVGPQVPGENPVHWIAERAPPACS